MNYTKPNEPDHEDSPLDWLTAMLTFGQALGHLLKPNEGVVIDVIGDMKIQLPDYDKLIVYNTTGTDVKVMACDENFPAGQLIWMHDKKESN